MRKLISPHLSCEICGKPITTDRYKYRKGKRCLRRYCSVACYLVAWRIKPKICLNCRKEFKDYVKTRKFCSRVCYGEARRKRILKTCPICKKKFLPSRIEGIYCGWKCSSLAQKNGHIIKCEGCGKEVYFPQCRIEEGRRFCSFACYRKHAKPSSLEKIMMKKLDELQIKYIPEYPLGNRLTADFFLPDNKIIIECDSEYWHKDIKQRDERKNRLVKDLGLKMVRLKEEEIENFDNQSSLVSGVCL